MNELIPRGALIVSCQALDGSPLRGAAFMGAMAIAAAQGGAHAIRVNGPDDVRAARAAGLPVIGLHKIMSPGLPVYITPNFATAAALRKAGADIIALDCTARPRDGEPIGEIVHRIIGELGVPVFADISTLEEGLAAEQMGAAYVSSTLAGYTDPNMPVPAMPDLALIEALAKRLKVPVVAEGRYNTPALARAALEAGAHAVVVGKAITDPREITEAFVAALGKTQ